MKIKALKNYFDIELRETKREGDEYEVEDKRGLYIISHGFAEEVKEAKKRTRKKKA